MKFDEIPANVYKICQRNDETSHGTPSDHLGPKTWNQRPKDQGSRSKAKTRKAFSPSSYHRGRSPRAGGAGGMREALTIHFNACPALYSHRVSRPYATCTIWQWLEARVVLPASAAFRFHPARADAGCRVSTFVSAAPELALDGRLRLPAAGVSAVAGRRIAASTLPELTLDAGFPLRPLLRDRPLVTWKLDRSIIYYLYSPYSFTIYLFIVFVD